MARRPPNSSLRAQAEARAEVAAAERRQLDVERMSSYSDDAFECESPHAMLASSRGLRPEQRSDVVPEGNEDAEANGHTQTNGASPYLVVDNIGRLRVDSVSDSDNHDEVAYGELAQPRPEIILRWKRFAVLVVLTAAVMTAIAAWLREGFVVYHDVDAAIADTKADTVNSYIGLIMGFIESIVGLGVEEIFPVFIVYLHNLRWYPGDDPATKKQSKFKKFALTIFIPAVMMAVGSSLSAIQANQVDDTSSAASTGNGNSSITTRHLMLDVNELESGGIRNSILKTALERKVTPMLPLDKSTCSDLKSDLFSAENLLAAAPKAVFGFPLQEWGGEFANAWHEGVPSRCYDFNGAGSMVATGEATSSDAFPMTMVSDLWFQGRASLLTSLRSSRKDLKGAPLSSASDLVDSVFSTLNATNFPVVSPAAVNATFETQEVNELLSLDALTLTIPLHVAANASFVCGEDNCAMLEPQLKPGRQLPRKQIGIAQLRQNCSFSGVESSVAANCETDPNGAFLYGFSTATKYAMDGSGDNVATRSLILVFARLTWRFEDSCVLYGMECRTLHYELSNDRYLAISKLQLPPQFQNDKSPFSVSLVQLMEPKLRLQSNYQFRFGALEHLESWASQDKASCSSDIDVYLQYVQVNHFFFGNEMLDTAAAAALLFIFQNARVLDGAPREGLFALQRRLADSGPRVQVFLTNTTVGKWCTWTGCGVLLVLTILVLVLPNERARLTPPRGGNARAERFVAVQTEQVYPNLIYKKRFLIGKTGEEIKFGEFAVESVGLHHKMEEDEQIYI